MATTSAGEALRAALVAERPLQCVGVMNAYHGRMAQAVGFRAVYVSGGGVSAGSLGLPDLGLSSREEVLVEVRRLTEVTELPVLVDADTGWGEGPLIGRTVHGLIRAGAAGMHIEDQELHKRCGHLPGKRLVPPGVMLDRIKAAVDARADPAFVIMARSDALTVEGPEAALERLAACVEAGADMVFPEAVTELGLYRRFASELGVPVLANLTEFGVTPLFELAQLATAGVAIALYPLSAFRAANAAALRVFRGLREQGSQLELLAIMQDRRELYEFLDYARYQRALEGDDG